MEDAHKPTRSDQIGHSAQPIPAEGLPRDLADLRTKALELAIASLGSPLRDITPMEFVMRAAAFEDYLTNGVDPAELEKAKSPLRDAYSNTAGTSRAYVEAPDGSYRPV